MQNYRQILLYCFLFLLLSITFCGKTKDSGEGDPAFIQAELEWRNERDQSMRSPTSWLTIAGLFWLSEGRASFGSDPQNIIRLPKGSAPAVAGEFILSDDEVIVVPYPQVSLKIDGKIIKDKVLKSDQSGEADIIKLNDLKMWVIERGGKYAIRLRDFNAPSFKKYRGLHYFLPREKYHISAEFIPYETPKTIILSTVVGIESEMLSPGYVSFELNGKALMLEVFASGPNPKDLFIIFKDETSGESTYEAARFLNATILADGKVDLNFNRAYNPPCAYTAYATCPLPPPQNHLPVKIEAGEKKYKKRG